jgi:hypothetical protein
MDLIAVKFTITYDDGSIKDVTKGILWYFEDAETITGDIVSLSGKELCTILAAISDLGVRFE